MTLLMMLSFRISLQVRTLKQFLGSYPSVILAPLWATSSTEGDGNLTPINIVPNSVLKAAFARRGISRIVASGGACTAARRHFRRDINPRRIGPAIALTRVKPRV